MSSKGGFYIGGPVKFFKRKFLTERERERERESYRRFGFSPDEGVLEYNRVHASLEEHVQMQKRGLGALFVEGV